MQVVAAADRVRQALESLADAGRGLNRLKPLEERLLEIFVYLPGLDVPHLPVEALEA